VTNKEAVIATIRIDVPDNSIEKALIDRDVTGGSTYTKSDAQNIALVSIDLLEGLLSQPDVSEGGFSVKYDRAAVQKQIVALAKKYDITEVIDRYKPTITSQDRW